MTGLSRPRGICVVEASVVVALMLFSDGVADIDPAASWGNGGTFISVRIDCFIDAKSWNEGSTTETILLGIGSRTSKNV